jgi:TPR repeat protein
MLSKRSGSYDQLYCYSRVFRKGDDSGDADGANDLGCCLELGEGVDPNLELAAKYYSQAASEFHPSGLYNIGRCFEYGIGIERDLVQAGHIIELPPT